MSLLVPPAGSAFGLPADLARNPRPSNWVRVAADGLLEVRAGKVELGQGIWTTQLQIAADELGVDPTQIRLRVGDTGDCPDQGLTAGSLSTEVGVMALRAVCAEIRARFVAAAARRFDVAVELVVIDKGRFAIVGGTHVGYLDLVGDVDLESPLTGAAKPLIPAARRFSGCNLSRPDLQKKLFGAGFIHDIEWPGMLHGRVVRPPDGQSRLAEFLPADQQAVLALPGVQSLHVDGSWIGVAANREEQSIAAAALIRQRTRWQPGAALPEIDPEQHWLRQQPGIASAVDRKQAANASTLASVAAWRHEADYSRPFLAHASIGPSCGLARWDDGHLTVCSHTQGSFGLRRELADLFDIDVTQVTVVHADGAGCYGHNGADDAAIDTAVLARAAGRPIRLQWSREDDLTWAPLGSAMSVRLAVELDERGRILRWHHEAWSYSHVQRVGIRPGLSCLASRLRDNPAPPQAPADFPLPAGGGQRNAVPIYAIPNRSIDYHLLTAPAFRTSALRALGAFANVFAIESCMDELAALCGQDPLDFRLAHLDDERARAVVEAAARSAGWRQVKAQSTRDDAVRGRGMGFARYKNSGAYCAVVVEVDVAASIRLDRVWVAVDAGEIIHLDGLINQIEGGVLQAASWSLKETVKWDRSGVCSRTWDDYPILSF
ncbi:MAG: molybdopterin cofactor-binding domain-containing protein, partial [Luteimonas sp.]